MIYITIILHAIALMLFILSFVKTIVSGWRAHRAGRMSRMRAGVGSLAAEHRERMYLMGSWFYYNLQRVLILYPIVGVLMGISLKLAIPQTNWYGVAYLAAVWPAWHLQGLMGFHLVVPAWAFN